MKLPKKRIRRNTVVREINGCFYGRVIRMLPDGNVFWLCCGYHFRINRPEELEVTGYKGRPDFNTKRFVHMTTLRQLKKRSARYHGDFAHNTPLDYEFIRRPDNA